MTNNDDKKGSWFVAIVKFVLMVLLVVGTSYFLFQKQITRRLETRDISFTSKVNAEGALKSHIQECLDESYYWKKYFKHQPPPKKKTHTRVLVTATLTRIPPGTVLTASNIYKPGAVALFIEVKCRGIKGPVYTKRSERSLAAMILTGNSGDALQDAAYAKSEKSILKDMHLFIDAAALHAMSRRPKQAEHYLPELVDAIAHLEPFISKQASAALCTLGPPAGSYTDKLKKLLNSRLEHEKKNAQKALDCIGQN